MMLKGKVALVTGSTRGIGWATACLFARYGATVLLNGHSNRALLEQRVAELQETSGIEVDGLFFDVSDYTAIKTAYQEIFKKYRKLDILVNNAGILEDALLGMISKDLIERLMAVNVMGMLYSLQSAARMMTRQGSGSIVNVSSIVGIHGNVGQVVYSASKAAVLGITKSAAKELAPYQIRVNVVAPGFIATDMTAQLPPDKYKERVANIKMQRIGSPEDVANAVLFLASDLSGYITGQVIGVDGGMLI
jgi:3-oxoacyl-[acyl-carrier protein] reductase